MDTPTVGTPNPPQQLLLVHPCHVLDEFSFQNCVLRFHLHRRLAARPGWWYARGAATRRRGAIQGVVVPTLHSPVAFRFDLVQPVVCVQHVVEDATREEHVVDVFLVSAEDVLHEDPKAGLEVAEKAFHILADRLQPPAKYMLLVCRWSLDGGDEAHPLESDGAAKDKEKKMGQRGLINALGTNTSTACAFLLTLRVHTDACSVLTHLTPGRLPKRLQPQTAGRLK